MHYECVFHMPSIRSSKILCMPLLRLEELSWAFSTILGTAVTIAGFMYYRFYQHIHNIFIGKRNEDDHNEAQQLQSITKILHDIVSVEVGGPGYQIKLALMLILLHYLLTLDWPPS